MEKIPKALQDCRRVFNGGRTRHIEWRRQQLHNMIRMLTEQSKAMCDALRKDLRKPETESLFMEINFTKNDAIQALNHLDRWVNPPQVKKDIAVKFDDVRVCPEPYGVTLIIGAWNYPIQLTLLPMVGAIAAGNAIVLKPSEVAEETAKLLEKIVPQYMDRDAIKVINGAVEETKALLAEKFDYIFYTGNNVVAKIIYEAAAKHLTPVTLELGGKSPTYIDRTSDMRVAARRVAWGRFVNCGQTCIAPDYVMCPKDVQDDFIENMKEALNDFYGSDPKASDSYGRIVNNRHFNRVKQLIDKEKVAIGGGMDEKDNYIEPTVLKDCKPTDQIMIDEVFGPVLPIMNVKDENEAIEFINSKDKSLAMYIFSKDQEIIDKFLSQTSSGGFTANDTLMNSSVETLPFGGVGCSGMGAYHGKYSFDTFSHHRGVMKRAQNMEFVNNLRYPPYTERKTGIMSRVMTKKLRKAGGGLLSYFPFVILGIIIAYILKVSGMQSHLPRAIGGK